MSDTFGSKKGRGTEVECSCGQKVIMHEGFHNAVRCSNCGANMALVSHEKEAASTPTVWVCRCKNCLKDFTSTSAATPLCNECVEFIASTNTDLCASCLSKLDRPETSGLLCSECERTTKTPLNPYTGEVIHMQDENFTPTTNPDAPTPIAWGCRCKNCLKEFKSISSVAVFCPECIKGAALGNTETFIASPSVCVECQKNFDAAFPNIRVCKECFGNPAAITTGVKHDAAKPRHSLLPHSIDDIIAVLEYGAGLYGERNWELGMEWSRPWNAALRHLWAWWRGEECDKESGLPHLAHAAVNCMFLLDYAKRGLGRDDRP